MKYIPFEIEILKLRVPNETLNETQNKTTTDLTDFNTHFVQ